MRWECQATLDWFKARPRCEWCGKPNRSGLDPHHAIHKRGIGGGSRLDIPWNLVALCRWPCHEDAERGRITKADMLGVISAREGVPQDTIDAFLKRLRRSGKMTREQAENEHFDLKARQSSGDRSVMDDIRFFETLLEQTKARQQ